MRSRRIILATLVVSSLLATACLKDVIREATRDVSEMKDIHGELTNKFGDPVYVNVNYGGGRVALSVTYINSPLNDKTREDRITRAQETADLVRARYPGVNDLSMIWVVFVREKRALIVFSERESIDFYGFDKDAHRLTSPPPGMSAGVELQTSTNYISDVNETDISVSGLQLEGTPGRDGVTVLPHFRVKGDVKAGRMPPPKEVSFDFASYSDNEQFQPAVPIVFAADGQPVWQTKGTFTASRTGNTVSEFCYLQVPYSAFRKMIGAQQLAIRLGAKVYYLAPEQFAEFRQMGRYVAE